MRKQPFTSEEFKSIYSRVPRVTIDAVIVHPEGLVLVQRGHESWHNMWSTPGGTILYQESVESAVRRVVEEEVGISITIERYLGHAEYFEIEERGYGHSISLNFLCRAVGDLPTINSEGEAVMTWHELPQDHIQEQVPFIEMGLTEWNKR